ncbi:MAG: hypothetical protein AB7U18_10410 [Dehalococcoidia bacterium]
MVNPGDTSLHDFDDPLSIALTMSRLTGNPDELGTEPDLVWRMDGERPGGFGDGLDTDLAISEPSGSVASSNYDPLEQAARLLDEADIGAAATRQFAGFPLRAAQLFSQAGSGADYALRDVLNALPAELLTPRLFCR